MPAVFYGGGSVGPAPRAQAQANVPIYSNNLVNWFQDYSWATVNYANTSPVLSGSTHSISVSASDYSALWVYNPGFNTANYTNLNFWINGGSGGGQVVDVQGVQVQNGNGVGLGGYTLPLFPWVKIPGNNSPSRFPPSAWPTRPIATGFGSRFRPAAAPRPFMWMRSNWQPVPLALTHIAINAAQPVRTADPRWFGINAATWDNWFDNSETISELNGAGWQMLRFPGGSESDIYQWTENSINNGSANSAGTTSFPDFAQVATNIGAQAIITVNYGTGARRPMPPPGWQRQCDEPLRVQILGTWQRALWHLGNGL